MQNLMRYHGKNNSTHYDVVYMEL